VDEDVACWSEEALDQRQGLTVQDCFVLRIQMVVELSALKERQPPGLDPKLELQLELVPE
jgi:hypothetical protein